VGKQTRVNGSWNSETESGEALMREGKREQTMWHRANLKISRAKYRTYIDTIK
jgi:hypothetical protein